MKQLAPGLHILVSHTDRPIGPGEVDGEDYHFVTVEQFDELLATQAFLTRGNNYKYRYGDLMPTEYHDCIVLEVIIDTALEVRRQYSGITTVIWLQPPGWTTKRCLAFLRKRLGGRGRDTDESIERRLRSAPREMRLGRSEADVCYTNRWSRVTAYRIHWLLRRRGLLRPQAIPSPTPEPTHAPSES